MDGRLEDSEALVKAKFYIEHFRLKIRGKEITMPSDGQSRKDFMQLKVTPQLSAVLSHAAQMGFYGSSRAEVARRILEAWALNYVQNSDKVTRNPLLSDESPD